MLIDSHRKSSEWGGMSSCLAAGRKPPGSFDNAFRLPARLALAKIPIT